MVSSKKERRTQKGGRKVDGWREEELQSYGKKAVVTADIQYSASPHLQ